MSLQNPAIAKKRQVSASSVLAGGDHSSEEALTDAISGKAPPSTADLGRSSRIAALQRAVAEGTYHVPAELVAEGILRHWSRQHGSAYSQKER